MWEFASGLVGVFAWLQNMYVIILDFSSKEKNFRIVEHIGYLNYLCV